MHARVIRLAIAGLVLASCSNVPATDAARVAPAGVETWAGVRRAAEDGSEAPMTLWSREILGGTGRVDELEVRTGKGVYRGLWIQAFDREAKSWVAQYVNELRGRFVRLEGTLDGRRTRWRSVSPDRRGESVLETERLDAMHQRRQQSVSDDGGQTWRVLFTDELTLMPRP